MNIVTYSPKPWEAPDPRFETGQHTLIRVLGNAGEMVRRLTAQKPDLVFLAGFEAADARYFQEVEQLCLALPHAAVVALQQQTQPEQLLSLMRAGVREVIADSDPETIRKVIERVQLRTRVTGAKAGRVIGFASAKGGDGASCLAANLAVALSGEPGTRVMAIDLSLPFGDLDMYLTGESHTQDLSDISGQSDRLDQSLLDSMVQHIKPTLKLISSPATLEKTVHIEPERVSELIRIAASHYDYLLLDFGPSLDQVGVWAIDNLDELCVVATPSLPSLRRAAQLLQLSKDFDKPVSRIEIILNRADSGGRLNAAEIESVIGRPVDRRFPSDTDAVQDSLLTGEPFLHAAPNSRLSKAIVDWASSLTGNHHTKRSSLWQRLKTR